MPFSGFTNLPFLRNPVVSPLDDRYVEASDLSYAGESAFTALRLFVEAEYILCICEKRRHWMQGLGVVQADFDKMIAVVKKLVEEITDKSVLGKHLERIRAHERVKKHDVAAIVVHELKKMSEKWKGVPILAKTRSQPAVSAQLDVLIDAFQEQFKRLPDVISTKMGGVVGGLNVHYFNDPDIDRQTEFDRFVERLGLKRVSRTTQTLAYSYWTEIFDTCATVMSIVADLKQHCRAESNRGPGGIVCSATESESLKFENSEGNAVALFQFLSKRLVKSRLFFF